MSNPENASASISNENESTANQTFTHRKDQQKRFTGCDVPVTTMVSTQFSGAGVAVSTKENPNTFCVFGTWQITMRHKSDIKLSYQDISNTDVKDMHKENAACSSDVLSNATSDNGTCSLEKNKMSDPGYNIEHLPNIHDTENAKHNVNEEEPSHNLSHEMENAEEPPCVDKNTETLKKQTDEEVVLRRIDNRSHANNKESFDVEEENGDDNAKEDKNGEDNAAANMTEVASIWNEHETEVDLKNKEAVLRRIDNRSHANKKESFAVEEENGDDNAKEKTTGEDNAAANMTEVESLGNEHENDDNLKNKEAVLRRIDNRSHTNNKESFAVEEENGDDNAKEETTGEDNAAANMTEVESLRNEHENDVNLNNKDSPEEEDISPSNNGTDHSLQSDVTSIKESQNDNDIQSSESSTEDEHVSAEVSSTLRNQTIQDSRPRDITKESSEKETSPGDTATGSTANNDVTYVQKLQTEDEVPTSRKLTSRADEHTHSSIEVPSPPGIHTIHEIRPKEGSKRHTEIYDRNRRPHHQGNGIEEYNMNQRVRGIALVINIEAFSKHPDDPSGPELHNRMGSTADAEGLEGVFRKLRFHVERHNNLDYQQISRITELAASTNHDHYGAFVLCILTHGVDGTLFDTYGRQFNLAKLIKHFRASKCPSLANKPKLFFIQACQGMSCQRAGAVTADVGPLPPRHIEQNFTEQLRNEADFLVFYPSCRGSIAHRHTTEGSWFIQSLVKHLDLHAEKLHLLEILTKVIRDVSHKVLKYESGEIGTQTPTFHSTLRYDLYLKPELFTNSIT